MHFGALAVQYFVSGRAAGLSHMLPVAGNLLHHAVEMALKADLAARHDIAKLKQLGHSLPRLWGEFKAAHPTPVPPKLDEVVKRLHDFEELRYPDSIVKFGAMIEWTISPESVVAGNTPPPGVPRYLLVLNDVDELMNFVFERASINPLFYTGAMAVDAKQFLTTSNPFAEGWSAGV
ncbi:MAG: hypothetical protein U1F08_10460 [Steroidobacteraceae bacterium]